MPVLTASGITGFSEAELCKRDYAYKVMDTRLYIGGKYELSKATINIGAEYNYGSKYWFSATQGAEDMYNKLATRGHVGETVWLYGNFIETYIQR